ILLALLVMLLVVGGLAWYVIPRLAGSSTPASQPGPVYPNVAGTYTGTLINATANITTGMSLSIQQSNANISGDFKVGAPLVGNNPFTGHVNPSKHIWFTVQSYQGNAPLYFDGSIQSDSSLAGSYCSLASNGKCNTQAGASGTWKVARKQSTAFQLYSVSRAGSGSGSGDQDNTNPVRQEIMQKT
ncbi:MAG: hypothetical protein ACJ795_22340, partial [Ktedonobacteraceae bacterium]